MIKKTSFMREHESYCKAARYANEDRGKKLPREFLRKPYGLAVKEEKHERT